jgi:hypothetical protein
MEEALLGELVLELTVRCDPAYEIGATKGGRLTVIPIVGGTFKGKLSGTVLPGGADWSRQLDERRFEVYAKYAIKTDDGEFIGIENSGTIDWSEKKKIRTSPAFYAHNDGKHSWLNQGTYVGSLEASSAPGTVEIKIYRLS